MTPADLTSLALAAAAVACFLAYVIGGRARWSERRLEWLSVATYVLGIGALVVPFLF